ncbi:MAG: multicopper oxidase domain-containing protein [Leptospirillia bacterium]
MVINQVPYLSRARQGLNKLALGLGVTALGLLWASASWAVTPSTPLGAGIQCPNDIDNMPYHWSDPLDPLYSATPGPEDIDWNEDGVYNRKSSPFGSLEGVDPSKVCFRVGSTDGYVQMPDGTNHFIFGFVNLTGVPEDQIVDKKFQATLPAPDIHIKEGQELFLTLTNLGLVVRPDLADPHTVHFHGYRHAVAAFDGVPELSVAVPPANSFTYYYKLNDPGTYGYHCHMEPTEHIALGMVGTIIVDPIQNDAVNQYAYNDGGAAPDTSYDKFYVLHMHDLDADKHYNLETVQEGSNKWSHYKANYFTLNGRAYPDTLLPGGEYTVGNPMLNNAGMYKEDYVAQPYSSLVEATAGERVLLRLNNLTYEAHTITIPGVPMHVVGKDAKILRGPEPSPGVPGKDLSYLTTSLSMSGGEEYDVIIDTTGLAPGTYFLYGRELQTQSNLSLTDRVAGTGAENRGGLITEIRISAGV